MRTKNAFTMIELVVIIIVVGILAAVALPRLHKDDLDSAAAQLVSHIRYTQHLAMQDNRYMDNNDNAWYKTRWQLVFGTSNFSDNKLAYTIFADKAGAHTGQADISEIAKDPQNHNKLLSGGYAGTFNYTDTRSNHNLNLGNTYGINTVILTGGCSNSRISFDYLGRPFTGNLSSTGSPYHNGRLIQATCIVTLTDQSGDTRQIAVEPETGYTHIINN